MELILHADYTTIPEYLYDNVCHNSRYCSVIHILTNQVSQVKKVLTSLDISCNIKLYDLKNYKHDKLSSESSISPLLNFREGFWIKTINRYFEINNFIQKQNGPYFHIENDVLIYTDLSLIYEDIIEHKDKLYFCRDNIKRALGSMMFIPDKQSISDLCNHMTKEISICFSRSNSRGVFAGVFPNDMQLLGSYKDALSFPTKPSDKGIIDACCFGQCLGGIDPRNTSQSTVGFVNETSDFKPELSKFEFRDNCWYYDNYKLHTLHIHSKNLKKFITNK